jgi:hypothetical protein
VVAQLLDDIAQSAQILSGYWGGRGIAKPRFNSSRKQNG